MGWIGPVVGGAITTLGQMGTNQANQDISQNTMNWETQMSNTAMTRRVDDLKNAGLNPLLAVGEGGASTPGMNPIPMQNPTMGLGQGVANAQQAKANIDNTNADTEQKKANANLTRNQTPDSLVYLDENGQVDWNKMPVSIGNLTAQGMQQDVANKQATWNAIQAAAKKDSTQADLNAATTAIRGVDLSTARQMQPILLNQAQKELGIASAGMTEAQARAKVMGDPKWGPILTAIGAVAGANPLGTIGRGIAHIGSTFDSTGH